MMKKWREHLLKHYRQTLDLVEYRKHLHYWKSPDDICATAYSVFYHCTVTQDLEAIYEKLALRILSTGSKIWTKKSFLPYNILLWVTPLSLLNNHLTILYKLLSKFCRFTHPMCLAILWHFLNFWRYVLYLIIYKRRVLVHFSLIYLSLKDIFF